MHKHRKINLNTHLEIGKQWLEKNNWKAFPFQLKTWQAYLEKHHGLLNAPTGSGKTFAIFGAIALEHLNNKNKEEKRLKAIWISPLRALTKELQNACSIAAKGLGLDWRIEIRSGDTKSSDRTKQLKDPPDVLITTPESLHVILATYGYSRILSQLSAVVVDEWHELMGSKRGVLVELALSKLKSLSAGLRIWGISATIANLEEAMDVLLGPGRDKINCKLIKSKRDKVIAVESIIPKKIEKYPWAGHLGIRLLSQIFPIILKSRSCLIFTNTRSQCEIWYQKILDHAPELAGKIAMHHGSISRELRDWVEEALHEERLKAVVCTSSLDLGVDFRPVETIIQIGSPKGVSRFIQRAGRSGHSPGAVSKIYFVPTHALELVEGAALRSAIAEGVQEPRMPFIRSFDVLIQYLMTLAVSEGFEAERTYKEIKTTHCFASITHEEWQHILNFMVFGGDSLKAYDEYQKLGNNKGLYHAINKRVALRHKLSIGTIVSDTVLQLKYTSGKNLGTIEEWFIARLKPGDVFRFAGRALELVRVKDMTVLVRKTMRKSGKVASWLGGRMPLSSMLSKMLRRKMYHYGEGIIDETELEVLMPLFEKQRVESYLPIEDEFLIEYFSTEEGHHLCMYPFEGRFVHEGMAALLANRIASQVSISFSIAMNDYGFELLSDKEICIEEIITKNIFSTINLLTDIQTSLNSVEMARRRFRDIAHIAGLIFQGFPGRKKKEKHLQSSSGLLFEVFKDYEPSNLLYLQSYEEVLTFQLEESRLRQALKRITEGKIVISKPQNYTPFSFPIIADRLSREKLSSESLEERVKKLMAQHQLNA